MALQEDLDEDEESALNLVETDGMLCHFFGSFGMQKLTFFSIDDVWDDDSAYMELLAEQVKTHSYPAYFFLVTCAHDFYFYFHFLAQSARLREKAESKDIDGDEDESDEDDQIEEELGFISPLDTVNSYTSFKQALTSCVSFFSFYSTS
jgi:hypothetical protein